MLAKFEFIELLDDPLAYIEQSLLPIDSDIHDRSEDADLIYAALAALRGSKSLSIFYSYQIQDPKNGVRQIADCIEVVKKTLEEKEQKYQNYINGIIRMISSHQVPFDSDQDRHVAILQLVEAYVIYIKQRGATEEDLRLNVINDTYLHCAYILHRAFQCIKSGGIPSRNDYEDGRICLHLKLTTPYCLVTNDRGTRDALKETSLLLTRLNDPQFATTLQVCDADHLKNLV